jgi:cell division protein FtsB
VSARAEAGPAGAGARTIRVAARPAAVRPPRPVLERAEPTPSVRLTARAALLLVIVLVMLAFAVAPLRAYLGERADLGELQRRAAQLEAENAVLEKRLQRLNDPDELERLARACLGMVHPGETAFVTIPAHGAPQPPDC